MGELGHVQVLDFTSGIPGGYCARLLGGAGADVVKVEPPEGDPLRGWVTDLRDLGGEDGALFRYLHFGHRSVVAESLAEVAELLAGADVVLTDGTGLVADAAALFAAHPHLVVTSISPFGLDGPYVDRPSSDLTVQAESGALAVRGHPDRPPIQEGGRITEWVSGLYAGVATLAALHGVWKGGAGRLIDLSQLEVGAVTGSLFTDLMYSLMGSYPLDDRPIARTLETPSIEPTLDGYVGFNTNTRMMFDSFLLLIERPDLIDAGWEGMQKRQGEWDEWNAIIHEYTTKHSTAEVIGKAVELRIPVAPVCDGESCLLYTSPSPRD